MTRRIALGGRASEPNQHLHLLHTAVEKAAADAGLDQRLIQLVYSETEYRAVAWAIVVINAFNRLGVTSRLKLPPEPR